MIVLVMYTLFHNIENSINCIYLNKKYSFVNK